MGILQIVAVIVFHKSTDQVLLINHNKLPYKDWWAFPGGKMEKNETLAHAARREVKEETGLIIEDPYVISFLNERVMNEGEILHHYLISYFVGISSTLEIENNNHREGQLAWFNSENLPTRVVPSDKKIIQQFKNDPTRYSTVEGVLSYSKKREEVDIDLLEWCEY